MIVSAGSALAQSSVWKVTSGINVVYLGGTCHVLRPQDYPLPAEFDAAYAASRELYFETDLAGMMNPATQQRILARGMFTDGTTLDRVLSPEAWQAVQAYSARAGVPLSAVSRMRPWMYTVAIASVEMQKLGITQEGVDVHFFQRAVQQGKATRGLETLDAHLDYLAGLGAGHENEMILSSLEELGELPEMFGAMLAAWKTGNVEEIEESMLADMREEFPSVYEELIVERNRKWLPVIEGMLSTEPTELVLVGAAHFAGPDGLLAALRAKGFEVEQVVAGPAAAAIGGSN
jgi:uncharacterized protein YbaP (TraB family)